MHVCVCVCMCVSFCQRRSSTYLRLFVCYDSGLISGMLCLGVKCSQVFDLIWPRHNTTPSYSRPPHRAHTHLRVHSWATWGKIRWDAQLPKPTGLMVLGGMWILESTCGLSQTPLSLCFTLVRTAYAHTFYSLSVLFSSFLFLLPSPHFFSLLLLLLLLILLLLLLISAWR